MKLFKKKVIAVACSSMMVLTGCGDLVVKVNKKPRNVDLSSTSNFGALNLDDPSRAGMLAALDNLKVVAVDLLIKELAKQDYRSEVRGQIRKYFDFLAKKASGPVSFEDRFYASEDECRESGLNFNMSKMDNAYGMILKTAVLAKLSEVNAGKINPGLSKEIQAIGQIILKELGLEIKGDVDVSKEGETTTTKGKFSLKLMAIDGEDISAEQKAKDAAQILEVSFERALGTNYIGHFDSTLALSHLDAAGESTKMLGSVSIKREAIDSLFVHTAAFEFGPEGEPASYSRAMTFKQMADNKKQIQVMDTINPKNADLQSTYVTLIDLDAGTQCKLSLGQEPISNETDVKTSEETKSSKGDELITPEAKSSTGGSTATSASTSTTTSSSTETKVNTQPLQPEIVMSAPYTGDSDDDTVAKADYSKASTTPNQSPSQSPTQTVVQSK